MDDAAHRDVGVQRNAVDQQPRCDSSRVDRRSAEISQAVAAWNIRIDKNIRYPQRIQFARISRHRLRKKRRQQHAVEMLVAHAHERPHERRMVVLVEEKPAHPHIETLRPHCCPRYAGIHIGPIVAIAIGRNDDSQRPFATRRQRTGHQVGLIVHRRQHFTYLAQLFIRDFPPVVNHAVDRSGRHTGHAGHIHDADVFFEFFFHQVRYCPFRTLL